MTLRPLTGDETVSSCLTGLQQVLNNDVATKLLLKYYQLSNCSEDKDHFNPDEEWQNFCNILLKLIGKSTEESFTSAPAKKSRTNSDEGEKDLKSSIPHCGSKTRDAWRYLLNNITDHNESLMKAGFDIPIQSETVTTDIVTNQSWDTNALLYQHIPSVVFVLHLIHEDLKLSSLKLDGVQRLGRFLLMLTCMIDWEEYVTFYSKEYSQIYEEVKNSTSATEPPSKYDLFFPSFVTNDPPNVFKCLMACLKGQKIENFPVLPAVCEQTFKIMMMYSLCIPTKDGSFCESADEIFNSIAFNCDQNYKVYFNEESKRCETPADRLVHFMAKIGFTIDDLNALPFGVSLPLREAIHQCHNKPSHCLSEESCTLIGREELAAQARMTDESINLCGNAKAVNNSDEVDDGMNFECEVTKLRFSIDHRIREVRRLLQSARPIRVSLVQNPEVSDHDFVQEQEARLLLMSKRTLSLSVGRGMFSLATCRPIVTELVHVPRLEITGRVLPRNNVVSLDHIDVPTDMMVWPAFHNGVAAGLRIVPGISQIDSTWIVYHRPKDCQLTNEHAGFLMALGLTGHLSNLAIMNVHNYLSKGHELTSIGLLIGLAATKRGTMDAATTKMLCIHIDALLPPTSAEIEVSVNVRSAAIIGIGLVYQESGHRLMTEVLLSEIGRPPGPEMENALNRECYSLCAGLALGLIMLEHGRETAGLSDLNISDHLYHYMVGGHKKTQMGAQSEKFRSPSYLIKEGDNVDINVTAPGAILALALIYLKSNDEIVASWLSAPETPVLAEFVRPDLLMLKLLARGLVLWDSVLPTKDWVQSHIPKIFQDYAFTGNSKDNNDNVSVDLETITQTYVNIIAGCCFAMGIKFAGSFNKEAYATLMYYTKYFKDILEKPEVEQCGRVVLEQCMNVTLLSLSMVMAGTGNLDILRLAREFHKRHSVDVTYGNHMAIHMAIGFLFLSNGRSTLSTSAPAVAALICALFPQFPSTSSDNRCHLQALRHLYVLAVEPRLLVPTDVDTKEACYCPVEISLRETQYYPETVIRELAPCLLPEVNNIKQVRIGGKRYWPVVLEGDELPEELRLLLSKGGTVFVKKRIGQLPYKDDPKGYRNLMARTFTKQAEKVDIVRSFSTDQELIKFTEIFCQNSSNRKKEVRCADFLSSVLLNCVSKETTSIVYTYFAIENALQAVENSSNICMLRELLIVLTYYENAFERLKKRNSELEPIINPLYIVEIQSRLAAHFKSFTNRVTYELREHVGNMDRKISKELVSYMTYHAMNEAKTLPRVVTKQNAPLEVMMKKCEELCLSFPNLLKLRSIIQS
ncbi:anaphase-promoting complex subunit 1-like isoform X2 [Xenia sp. Carnegie-2017]|uniref:anaphase-promoting complex subunit 1-like isoform X2 n=1 Tax=Xenia sp. Carnegie-2017 TaxID=2897299 RepID=UPI001F04CAA3|nr:anaphase-promoting complex subunit 1-like isoform X2 [Xenia sp. Carnegie-2017]